MSTHLQQRLITPKTEMVVGLSINILLPVMGYQLNTPNLVVLH